MPRQPVATRQRATGGGRKPSRGEAARRRVEVWLTHSEDAALASLLGRQATAADVRALALASTTTTLAASALGARMPTE